MTTALAFAIVIALQISPPPGATRVAIPTECPVLLLTHSGGLGTEAEGGILVAVWKSGYILRAQSVKRASGTHLIGRLKAPDLQQALDLALRSRLWRLRSQGVAVDSPEDDIELQRGAERLGWAETPGVTATAELAALKAALFKLHIETPAVVRGPLDASWKCPAVRWSGSPARDRRELR